MALLLVEVMGGMMVEMMVVVMVLKWAVMMGDMRVDWMVAKKVL